MGSSYSVVPISSVRVICKPKPSKTTKKFVLNPRLCQSIFHVTEGYCKQTDIQPLKKFIFSDSNLKPTNMSKKIKIENELIKIINLPPNVSDTKMLSPNTAQYLESVLVHLKSQDKLAKPFLVSNIIEPKLEDIFAKNQALVKQNKLSSWTLWVRNCLNFMYSQFRFKLTPKILRKAPRLKAVSGLDRAHKLSLSLAVEMWKHIYGHPYVKRNTKKMLANALNVDYNMYYTCRHTNRTIHVKYDKEIIDSIKDVKAGQGQVPISSGAKIRVKQVLSALQKIEKRLPEMSDFCGKCRQELKTLL